MEGDFVTGFEGRGDLTHMTIRLVVAVTDNEWFDHLRTLSNPSEVNFWAPSAAPFKALQTGELFLFKLHSPLNFVVGGGVFAYSNTLPCSLAWEAFGELNGTASLAEMRQRILRYRRGDPTDRSDFVIGCRVLTQPFFFERANWIPAPESWARNIVTSLTEGAAPSYAMVAASTNSGWCVEHWAAELLTCKMGRQFDQTDDEMLERLVERRTGPIGAATLISIALSGD